MKRNFIPVLPLMIAAIIGFSGCDSAIGPTAATARNTSRAAALDAARSGELEAVTVTGPLAVVDGEFAVLYQGSTWYIKGLSLLADTPELAEGVTLTVTGEAAPVLDRDTEGNSLFFGYYLTVENLSIN
jgi:hypothetical protein